MHKNYLSYLAQSKNANIKILTKILIKIKDFLLIKIITLIII